MKKDPISAELLVNEFKSILKIPLRQTVKCSLLKYTIDPEIWPLLQHITPLPQNSPLKIPFLPFPLINKCPGEITTNKFLIPPLIKALNHTRLATSNLKDFHILVNELNHKIFDESRFHIPVVNLLLLDLVSCVPVCLLIVVRKVLWEVVLLQECLVLGHFC